MTTAFRDGFQSVYGARVFTDDFLPAVAAARDAGINYFEAGGGARFQSLYFYCNEDAFEMMDRFRQTAGPEADLQTLARGVNVVGLESQSSDVIELHARLFQKHGITTIRNFDALNDVDNLVYSGKCIHEAGLKHQVSVTMMELPPGVKEEYAHTPEFYIDVLKKIMDADIPFDSVCFKDASGTSTPAKVYQTIKLAKELLKDKYIHFHTHETAGIGALCYKAALDGGADGIDLSMAPVSGGTGQTDIVTMWHALRGTEYDLGVDINKILEAENVFKECMKDYFMPPEAKAVEPIIPFSPMPGGALTANTQMMRDNDILDKFPEVIAAMEEVVMKGGYGTSVTPVSQFYFQQAFNNVMLGKWKKIADGYGKMVLGYFGKTPVEPDSEVVKLAAQQLKLEPTTKKVQEINDADPQKGLATARKLLEENGITDLCEENLFIAATCKQKGVSFLKGEGQVGVRKKQEEPIQNGNGDQFTVKVNDNSYQVIFENNKALVNGTSYQFEVEEGLSEQAAVQEKSESADDQQIKAPMPGNVIKVIKSSGDSVVEGEAVIILEAMKMETEVKSPKRGVVTAVSVKAGDKVNAGQRLFTVA